MTFTINLDTILQLLQIIFYFLASLIIVQFILIGISLKRITTRIETLSDISKWQKRLRFLSFFQSKKD